MMLRLFVRQGVVLYSRLQDNQKLLGGVCLLMTKQRTRSLRLRANSSCFFADEPEDALVHAEHDGGAGDGSKEMRRHAPVEAGHPLLFEDELEALE